ncbi:cell division protein ZipA [Onishia taeanensis]
MELREWLIILGLTLVTIIVIDGVRRLQRQRRVPRLDQVDASSTDAASGSDTDPEQEARDAEVRSELPNGGARVVRPAAYDTPRPKPKLQRQEHPGPSRVLSSWRQGQEEQGASGRPADDPRVAAPRPQAPAAKTASRPDEAAEASPRPSEPHHAPHADAQNAARRAAADAAPARHGDTAAREPEGTSNREIAAANGRGDALDRAPGDIGDDVRARNGVSGEEQGGLPGLAADPADHEGYHDDERYRLVDFDGVSDSLRDRSARVGDSMQRFGSSIQQKMASRKEKRKKDKLERERQKAERQARETSRRQQEQAEREAEARRAAEAAAQRDGDDPLFSPRAPSPASQPSDTPRQAAPRHDARDEYPEDGVAAASYADEATVEGMAPHPSIQRALRNGVKVEHARDTLSDAEEIIVISVMSRDEEGFSGTALLDLMLACGLRYCRDMQIFHRFETEDPHSALQFSMVNIVKPGTFPLAAGEDFTTPGISLLMPLPGAHDSSAAFEAMVETAMVVVRHLGGELKDENQSVMTAQTVGFARERVQEFDRRHRLHRTQAN